MPAPVQSVVQCVTRLMANVSADLASPAGSAMAAWPDFMTFPTAAQVRIVVLKPPDSCSNLGTKFVISDRESLFSMGPAEGSC